MLVELGRLRERAWVKDFKSKVVAEKSGYEQDFSGRCRYWTRKEEQEKEE